MTTEYRDKMYHVFAFKHPCLGMEGYVSYTITDEGEEITSPWHATQFEACQWMRRSIGQRRRSVPIPRDTAANVIDHHDATPEQVRIIRAERFAVEERRRAAYESLSYPPKTARS